MNRDLSIVLSNEIKDYRRLAQEFWGLTNDQMVGMHVHHYPPRSQGGRNIPEHLYVCSESMHHYGWHNANIGLVSWASAAGKSGGQKSKSSGKGIHDEKYRNSEEYKNILKRAGRTSPAGRINSEKGVGICNPDYRSSEEFKKVCSEAGKIGGRIGGSVTRERYGRPVLCLETGTEYPSASKAGESTNIPQGNISRSARSGGTLSAGGYHWKYSEEVK